VASERELVIRNREGLHFRPIMQLVDAAQRYSASATVHCDGRQADVRSPMELLMLVATHGARVKLVADGDDADKLLETLAGLIDSGFGES
jgi:phosphocarrier protein